jgi:hypothetical protein
MKVGLNLGPITTCKINSFIRTPYQIRTKLRKMPIKRHAYWKHYDLLAICGEKGGGDRYLLQASKQTAPEKCKQYNTFITTIPTHENPGPSLTMIIIVLNEVLSFPFDTFSILQCTFLLYQIECPLWSVTTRFGV